MKEHVHLAVYAKECFVELEKEALGFISLQYEPEESRLGVTEKTTQIFDIPKLMEDHFSLTEARVYLFRFQDTKGQC